VNLPTFKPVELWTEADIQALPVGEWDWLELKGSAWLAPNWQAKMSEYVSAWANYDGGYLVIGVANPSLGQPIEIEGIDLSTKGTFMEQLDMVLPRLVEPLITKFTTHAVPVKSGSRFVIVVHIPESADAPHQAQSRKYYARRGRHLDALPHRAVLDILNRRRYPRIQTVLAFTMNPIGEANLHWKIANISDVLARHVKAVVHFPTKVAGHPIMFDDDGSCFFEENEMNSFWELRLTNGLSPLFPRGDMFRNLKAKQMLRFDPEPKPSIDLITITTYADSMPPFVEKFQIKEVVRKS
jgi:hypothetical protein